MSVRVTWVDDTKTAILREFEGTWTWEEFYASQGKVNAMLNSVEHNVHQIFDFSHSQSLPPNTLTHLRNSGRGMPENRGKSVVITNSTFYQQMYRVLKRVFPSVTTRVVMVKTRDEALTQIQPAEAKN